ncbi:uncharacterized protein At4g38062-like [Amaranthus tricolor]|uniref:uncharacterized protein At4g38062-like n=1 Tax=Amaranthus tricolor TaxID=29722 RepID=UPI00258ED852|nr:uncharacterized protein At4g38062-like [Amaranthus tricolor]XP_057515821.1 uncharacterized protein At4g38062-like [Amaranthus tricolor]XP_057515831.1 uncharacterized protein At4g38062-like [Amaranthus tricolor]XP_057515839.1 uncharacterized protein At4g38062-like [Amaranthus tricolor]XP_057515849.1 uncharacterized protein At4g38062-like [Amaranthus tricolor]XP_057515857.1 uncharacterized protein At4g38062-like [Amaranthus tricolor]
MMEGVYKELNELRAELEKLKEEHRIKTELSESSRRVHTDQLAKSREVTLQKEEETKELHDKFDELAELRHLYGEVKSKLLEMELSLKQVSSVNEKIWDVKYKEEVILNSEEESMRFQDQLKREKEQFLHLEEAHTRLQDLFQSSKKEWPSEKSDLLEEIIMLESKLDSQIRITESLESRLKMCNQALVHEGSRRKALEVQLSESKQCFGDVLAEYEEAKAKIVRLSNEHDEDMLDLRNSLEMKETLLKKMEYKVTRLEQDNKELYESLKELRESQIEKRNGDPSVNKLRDSLKDVEQVHSTCSLPLKEREAKWNMKTEKMMGDIKCYQFDLKRQREQLEQLKMQLDSCHLAMKFSGEQTSVLLLMIKSELSDAYAKLFKSEDQIEALNKDIGDCAPSKARAHCVEHVHEEITLMAQKLGSVKLLEEHSAVLESALLQHNRILEESSDCQIRLKEQVSQMEVFISNLSTALEQSNSELAAKLSEATQTQIELQMWKSKAEIFRTCLEQSQEVCRKMEKTFLEQTEREQVLRTENESCHCKMKEQEQKIEDLHLKTASLNKTLIEKEEDVEAMRLVVEGANKKVEHYLKTLKERDATVENLQKHIKVTEQSMRQKSEAAESARREAQSKFQLEKEELRRTITAQKDEQIRCLQEFASSLENDLMDLGCFSLARDIENMIKILALEDALENYELRVKAEVESKNNVIHILTEEVSNVHERMLIQGQSLLYTQQSVKELEAQIKAKNIIIEKLLNQSREDQYKLKELVLSLEQKNEVATATIKRLSFERDNLVAYLEGISEQFGVFCTEDSKLEQLLGKMLQTSDILISDDVTVISGKVSNASRKDVKKEVFATSRKLPLREINH